MQVLVKPDIGHVGRRSIKTGVTFGGRQLRTAVGPQILRYSYSRYIIVSICGSCSVRRHAMAFVGTGVGNGRIADQGRVPDQRRTGSKTGFAGSSAVFTLAGMTFDVAAVLQTADAGCGRSGIIGICNSNATEHDGR